MDEQVVLAAPPAPPVDGYPVHEAGAGPIALVVEVAGLPIAVALLVDGHVPEAGLPVLVALRRLLHELDLLAKASELLPQHTHVRPHGVGPRPRRVLARRLGLASRIGAGQFSEAKRNGSGGAAA